jgi:hypothetical protein
MCILANLEKSELHINTLWESDKVPTATSYANSFLPGPSAHQQGRRSSLAVGIEQAMSTAAVGIEMAVGIGSLSSAYIGSSA